VCVCVCVSVRTCERLRAQSCMHICMHCTLDCMGLMCGHACDTFGQPSTALLPWCCDHSCDPPSTD